MILHVLLKFILSLSGFALRTKTAPDVKEAYGKIKKQESVNDEKHPDIQSSTKKKPLVVKFNNVAFLEEHGERFWFFGTHVIPGNKIMLQVQEVLFRCFGAHFFIIYMHWQEMSGTR